MNPTPDISDVSRRQMLAQGAVALLADAGCAASGPLARREVQGGPKPLGIAPDDEIRTAIIGVGGRGNNLLDAMLRSPKVRVAAICDLDAGKRDAAAAKAAAHQPALYECYHQMLAQMQLDAAFVATPCYLHTDMCIDVLNAGLHCYGEKPMAIHTRDLERMVRTVEKARRVYQVGTQLPYASPWHGAIAAIRRGDIGEPILIRAHRHNTGDLPHEIPWFFQRKLSGDTILEQAVHEFDIFNAVFQAVPERASGFGGQALLMDPPGRDIRDHYGLLLEYGKNKRVVYSHSWIATPSAPHGGRQELVIGSEGTVDIEAGMIYPKTGDPRPVDAEPAGDPTQRAVDDFFACIREGRTPLTDVIRGRDGALVGLLGLKALDTGRVVTMSELRMLGYGA